MLTQEKLRQLLSYDPDTGIWRWLKTTSNRALMGAVAGRKGGSGHWQIGVDGKRYPSARLAFLYMTGKWPIGLIDHCDCDPDNGRWSNLREASKSLNGANRGKNSNNTSGYKGVTWSKREKRWYSQIHVNGKHIHLGIYDDPEIAHNAYISAAVKYFGEYART